MFSTAEIIHTFMENHEESHLENLEKDADSGNKEAQFQLGLLYSYGKSVEVDTEKAVSWLEKSSEQDYSPAITILAWMYLHGEGVTENPQRALELYQNSAAQDDIDAQCALGDIYLSGKPGIEVNHSSMLHWYEKAANAGHPKAQYMLGKLLAEGEVIQKNDEAAFQWLTLAIMNQSEPAQKELSMLTARLDKETLESYKSRMMTIMGQQPH